MSNSEQTIIDTILPKLSKSIQKKEKAVVSKSSAELKAEKLKAMTHFEVPRAQRASMNRKLNEAGEKSHAQLENEKKMQNIPLMLIGDYDIIIEKQVPTK